MLPRLRPAFDLQGIGMDEGLIDPGTQGQRTTLLAKRGIKIKAMHRHLPGQRQQSPQMALATAPIHHGPPAIDCGSGKGFDLGALATGDFPIPKGVDGRQVSGGVHGELDQRHHFSDLRKMAGEQV